MSASFQCGKMEIDERRWYDTLGWKEDARGVLPN
jgi:hypothetical protein